MLKCCLFVFPDVWFISTSLSCYETMGKHNWPSPFGALWHDRGVESSWSSPLFCKATFIVFLTTYLKSTLIMITFGFMCCSLSWHYLILWEEFGRGAQLANHFQVCRSAWTLIEFLTTTHLVSVLLEVQSMYTSNCKLVLSVTLANFISSIFSHVQCASLCC